jgi:hypothetical protein
VKIRRRQERSRGEVITIVDAATRVIHLLSTKAEPQPGGYYVAECGKLFIPALWSARRRRVWPCKRCFGWFTGSDTP